MKLFYAKMTMRDVRFTLILITLCSSTASGKFQHFTTFATKVVSDGLAFPV